jgi:hypothetical protein
LPLAPERLSLSATVAHNEGMVRSSRAVSALALLAAVWVSILAPWGVSPALCAQREPPDPPVYDRLFLYDATTGRMDPLPMEKVKQRNRKGAAQAWLEGERSAFRVKAGAPLVLVIAYSFGLPPGWVARAYRFRVEGGRRVVQLGVWAATRDAQWRDGALPVKMEPHAKLGTRIVLPAPLPPGEYAVSNPSGSRAFTFGVDP